MTRFIYIACENIFVLKNICLDVKDYLCLNDFTFINTIKTIYVIKNSYLIITECENSINSTTTKINIGTM